MREHIKWSLMKHLLATNMATHVLIIFLHVHQGCVYADEMWWRVPPAGTDAGMGGKKA